MAITTYSFETDLGPFVDNPDGNVTGTWQRHTGATPSSGTGPSAAHQGSYYVYVEASDGSGFYTNGAEAILQYDGFVKELTYWLTTYGDNMGTLYVEGYTGSGWVTITTHGTFNDIKWFEHSFQFTTGYNAIRFRAVAAGDYLGDMALDYITIDDTRPFSTYRKDGGLWKQTQELWKLASTNFAPAWRKPESVHIKDGGIWKQAFGQPASPFDQDWNFPADPLWVGDYYHSPVQNGSLRFNETNNYVRTDYIGSTQYDVYEFYLSWDVNPPGDYTRVWFQLMPGTSTSDQYDDLHGQMTLTFKDDSFQFAWQEPSGSGRYDNIYYNNPNRNDSLAWTVGQSHVHRFRLEIDWPNLQVAKVYLDDVDLETVAPDNTPLRREMNAGAASYIGRIGVHCHNSGGVTEPVYWSRFRIGGPF